MKKKPPRDYNLGATSCQWCGKSIPHKAEYEKKEYCAVCRDMFLVDDIIVGAYEMMQNSVKGKS